MSAPASRFPLAESSDQQIKDRTLRVFPKPISYSNMVSDTHSGVQNLPPAFSFTISVVLVQVDSMGNTEER